MKGTLVVAVCVAAFVLLVAPVGAGPGGGLAGSVTRVTPSLCAEDVPCEAPAARTTLSFYRGGSAAARATTNLAGAYRVSLPAGDYVVRVGKTLRGVRPARVHVPAGSFAHVDFRVGFDAQGPAHGVR